MTERPSDCGIHIEKLEESLMNCFQQWKEITEVLNRYLGRSEFGKMKDLDCIDCFFSDMKDRQAELRKRNGHTGSRRFGSLGEPP